MDITSYGEQSLDNVNIVRKIMYLQICSFHRWACPSLVNPYRIRPVLPD